MVTETHEKIDYGIAAFDSLKEFRTEAEAVARLAERRWNGSPICPWCASDRVYITSSATQPYKCGSCNRRFTVKTDTIMGSSHVSVKTWLHAIYLLIVSQASISAAQLAKTLKVTPKTALLLRSRIHETEAFWVARVFCGEVARTGLAGRRANVERLVEHLLKIASFRRKQHYPKSVVKYAKRVTAKNLRSVAFIGGGNMAEAFIASLTTGKRWQISVSEPLVSRRQYLNANYENRITVDDENVRVVDGADIVVLAVKPQQFSEVAAQLRDALKSRQVVMSIMAGITVNAIREGLEADNVVRTMPNIAVKQRKGVTFWCAGEDTSSSAIKDVKELLGTVGIAVKAESESQLDTVTALSGSGPAYVFAFMEALQSVAVELKLSDDVARAISLETVLGGGALAAASGSSFGQLREQVTSQGGTTAAALEVLREGEFGELIEDAVRAAYKRSIALGGGKT